MASEASIDFGAQPYDERERLRAIRLTATASLIGTTIEWYDFILYTSLAGLIFNNLVRRGEVSAPVVIGRDHLDTGSVASPYRETEAMKDGSDAIADWPILNALLNASSGATWVSVHHGGGVGIGYSLHAGMVVVADGTDLAAQKLERVLTTDPAMGVLRHVDAGYERAVTVARERGIHVPMSPAVSAPEGRPD